jgi:hypothetical protein
MLKFAKVWIFCFYFVSRSFHYHSFFTHYPMLHTDYQLITPPPANKIPNSVATVIRACSKRFLLIMAALLVSTLGARAQNLTVSASTVNHPGGYQVTCHGSNDGSISLNISGGVPPYSILWSNNSSANPLTGLAAGVYTATVTDSLNNTAQVQVTLLQPPALSATSSISNYNGFAISTFTKVDGQVQVHPQGGTPPYTVVWNDNFNGAVRDSLSAGTYSFTLSDVNGCSTTGSRTLNQPTALQVSVSQVQGTQCHDTQDGSALLNISGGVPPYSIGWDNGSFSEQPNNLNAGENHFIVRDANQARVESMVVIPQPTKMQLTLHASQYANGMNVSCYDCYNGSLTAQVIGGTAPYTYYWNEDTIAGSATLNNLNGGEQKLSIADANGCRTSHGANLRMPERSDWTMFGNTGSDPATQFIGTSDSSDVVFKTNGQEAMRIKSSSEIEFLGKLRMLQVEDINPFDVSRKLVLDADGNLKIMPSSTVMVEGPNFEPIGCNGCACLPRKDDNPGWGYSVNMMGGVPSIANQDDIVACPNTGNVGIGTYLPEANSKLDLIGDIAISGSRLHVGYDGKVGIGTDLPVEKLQVDGNTVLNGNVRIGISNSTSNNYTRKLVVEGIVLSREFRVTDLPVWPDFVFSKNHKLKSLNELKSYIEKESHLPDIPSEKEVKEKGDYSINEMIVKLLQKQEESTLYILQLHDRIEQLEKETERLRNSTKF